MTNPDPRRGAGEAVIVFCESSALWWMRYLRPGFRHCFACVPCGGHWVLINPLSHHTQVAVAPGSPPAALARWYEAAGMRTRIIPLREPPRVQAPIRPYTCVEAVKRLIGLHDPWVLTPWQLYRRLTP
jgi:hypothetical protein